MVSDDRRQKRIDEIALALFHESAGPALPWYDSGWLRTFIAVRSHLAAHYPGRVEDFDAMIAPLRTNPDFTAQHVSSFIEADTMAQLRDEVSAIVTAPVSTYERTLFGRDLLHDRPLFTDLATSLVPRVSAIVGEPVEPYYNFLSLYGATGVCTPHIDAPEAKWTLDICIDQSHRWPLHISRVTPWPTDWDTATPDDWQAQIRATHDFTALTMDPADAVFFAGSSQWHYRDEFPSNDPDGFCHLLFLHYIPAGSAQIVNPDSWASLLDVPGIATFTARYRSHYQSE